MSPVVCCVVLLYVSVGILALLLLSNLSTFQSFPCMEKILGTPHKMLSQKLPQDRAASMKSN